MIYPNSDGLEQIDVVNLTPISLFFVLLLILVAAALAMALFTKRGNKSKKGSSKLLSNQPILIALSAAVLIISVFALTASAKIQNDDMSEQMAKTQNNLEQNYGVVFLNDINSLPANESTIVKVDVAPTTDGLYRYPSYAPRMAPTQYNKCYITLNQGHYSLECLAPLNSTPIYYYDTPVMTPEPYQVEPDRGIYNDYGNMMPEGAEGMGMLTPDGSASGTWDRQTYDGGTDTPMDYNNELGIMGPTSR